MPDTAYLDEIKQTYCRGLTEDEYDYFSERAAIYEFDAGLPRHQAEALAMTSVLARRDRLAMEKERGERNG